MVRGSRRGPLPQPTGSLGSTAGLRGREDAHAAATRNHGYLTPVWAGSRSPDWAARGKVQQDRPLLPRPEPEAWRARPERGGRPQRRAPPVGTRLRMRVPWTTRRFNQSILKEISPEYSLEGLMLKLKLQYLGCLMRRTDSLDRKSVV